LAARGEAEDRVRSDFLRTPQLTNTVLEKQQPVLADDDHRSAWHLPFLDGILQQPFDPLFVNPLPEDWDRPERCREQRQDRKGSGGTGAHGGLLRSDASRWRRTKKACNLTVASLGRFMNTKPCAGSETERPGTETTD